MYLARILSYTRILSYLTKLLGGCGNGILHVQILCGPACKSLQIAVSGGYDCYYLCCAVSKESRGSEGSTLRCAALISEQREARAIPGCVLAMYIGHLHYLYAVIAVIAAIAAIAAPRAPHYPHSPPLNKKSLGLLGSDLRYGNLMLSPPRTFFLFSFFFFFFPFNFLALPSARLLD